MTVLLLVKIYENTKNNVVTIMMFPVANPSNPSVKLTAFEEPTITIMAKRK